MLVCPAFRSRPDTQKGFEEGQSTNVETWPLFVVLKR